MDNRSNLKKYLITYLICVGLNILVLVVTFLAPIAWVFFYAVLFVPFMFFSFKLNKSLIKYTKLKNSFINLVYKIVASFLIWFMAFFPLSLLGIFWVLEIPERYEEKQEIALQKEQILESETYADLTGFGLGEYKLVNKGDEYLWDITKPKDFIGSSDDGKYIIYEYAINRVEYEWWGSSDESSDTIYDVVFYDETYIIIPPIWEKSGTSYYWDLIYLCKDINPEEDLFEIGILEPEVVDRLLELPSEQYTRKELSEMLGKDF